MAREVHLWVSDDAVVEVVEGVEYGDRITIPVPHEKANRQELMEQAADAIVTLQGHIDDVNTELTAWPGYDAASVKASLQDEILPALRFALVVEKRLARLIANVLDAVD